MRMLLMLLVVAAAHANTALAHAHAGKTHSKEVKQFPPKTAPTCGLFCENQSNPKTACWKCKGFSKQQRQITLDLTTCKFEDLACVFPPGCQITKVQRSTRKLQQSVALSSVIVTVPPGFNQVRLMCRRQDMAYRHTRPTTRSLRSYETDSKHYGGQADATVVTKGYSTKTKKPLTCSTTPELLSCPSKGWFHHPTQKGKKYWCAFPGTNSECAKSTPHAACYFTINFTDRAVCPATMPHPAPSPVSGGNVTTGGGRPCPSPSPKPCPSPVHHKPCPSPVKKVHHHKSPKPCPSPPVRSPSPVKTPKPCPSPAPKKVVKYKKVARKHEGKQHKVVKTVTHKRTGRKL